MLQTADITAHIMRPIKGEVMRRRYTFGSFIKDAIGFFLTGGLWLIWVIVRETRKQY